MSTNRTHGSGNTGPGDGVPENRRCGGEDGHGSKDQRLTLEQAGLDGDERAVLQLLRHYCVSYSSPESQDWEVALAEGRRVFGSLVGAQIAVSVHDVLCAMRVARKSMFLFTNPYCSCCRNKISRDELRLLRIIQTVRGRASYSLRAEAMILCEGFNAEPLLEAVARLSDYLLPASAATA